MSSCKKCGEFIFESCLCNPVNPPHEIDNQKKLQQKINAAIEVLEGLQRYYPDLDTTFDDGMCTEVEAVLSKSNEGPVVEHGKVEKALEILKGES